MSEYIPSPQQADFYKWVKEGRGSCVLEAVAGAGKSTTLARAMGLMDGMVVALMYNRSASLDFKAKVEEVGVASKRRYVSTCHAIAKGHWDDYVGKDALGKPKCQVDDGKVKKLINKMVEAGNPDILRFQPFITKLVSFGKQFLMGVPDTDPKVTAQRASFGTWRGLAIHFGLDEEIDEDGQLDMQVAIAIEIFNQSHAQCRQVIDFDDMIYAPIAYNVKFFKNDWVLIDEAQDINPARRELCRRLLKNGGRLVACGDSRQAIYGFTGAGADSLDRIAKEFGCKRLPLTVTYRCPKQVVSYAHQWVSHIEAHESAPEGIVRPYVCVEPAEGEKAKPWHEHEGVRAGDAILCRYSAPLIKAAYSMLREGRACKVEGREIGRGLRDLAQKWKVKTLDALEGRLEKYLANELKKAAAQDKPQRAEEVEDKVDCLKIFIGRCRAQQKTTITDLVGEIESIFDDEVKGVAVLATGHKAKGREWHRVFWIQAAPRRRDQKMKPWQAVQEDNVKYVIATRAKHELVLLQEGM